MFDRRSSAALVIVYTLNLSGMLNMSETKNKYFLGIVSGILMLAGLGILYSRIWLQPHNSSTIVLETPHQVSLTGLYICLPHKDTSGPQTMECALGMKADDGTFYALDTSNVPTNVSTLIATNVQIKVEGMLIPIEQISTNQWDKYGIKGIIQVTSMTEL